MHQRRLIDINRELECALAARTSYFLGQLEDIGIDSETAVRLMIGRLHVKTSSRLFKPAHPKDGTARKLAIMPTGWDDREQPIDLMAFDGRNCWFRLGIADHLGDPFSGPIYRSPGAWLKAGAFGGSVNLGVAHG